MEEPKKIVFENSVGYKKIITEGKPYPSEVAKAIVNDTIKPFIELEEKGYIEGLSFVWYGGAVEKPKRPKDYDFLALYDNIRPHVRRESELSKEAQRLLERVYPWNEDIINDNLSFSQDYYNEPTAPYYTEVNLRSATNFLKNLDETSDQKLDRVLHKLILLPESIYQRYVPPDEILNSEPFIEWAHIDDAATMWLTVSTILGHKPSQKEIDFLSDYSPKIRDFIEKNKTIDNLNELVNIEQREALEKGLSEVNVNKRRLIATGLLRKFADERNFFTDRIYWICESLARDINIEDQQATSGLLIYGKNVINNGKSVFKEDLDWLKEK